MTDTSKLFSIEFGPPDARRRERVRRIISLDGQSCWVIRHPHEDREVVLARGLCGEDEAEIGRRAREKVAEWQAQQQQ